MGRWGAFGFEIQGHGKPIAIVNLAPKPYTNVDEAISNAYLMAAAPQLAQQVALALEWLDRVEQVVGTVAFQDAMPNNWGGRKAMREALDAAHYVGVATPACVRCGRVDTGHPIEDGLCGLCFRVAFGCSGSPAHKAYRAAQTRPALS